ncbi:MAG TPA: FtsX-like permease family protein [Steroidobacteraceae bacterium]|nr:FtsX-like permease family protein [Steroidobacteraceae bacterium]
MNAPLTLAFALQVVAAPPPAVRTIAIDERLAADARLSIGDTVTLSATPGDSLGDRAVISAIVRRSADPAEVARDEYRVFLHLDQLQRLVGYGDRVDRFAIATTSDASTAIALQRINDAAFGFRAHRSRDIAVETSRTFQVVSRFHRAIGVITIVASSIFLLCILLLKVDERRRDIAALRLIGVSRATVMRSVMIEAAAVSIFGSGLGALLGWAASALVNNHYQAVYRTPLRFTLVTPGILIFAITLSLALGIVAGYLAAQRLVRTPPLLLFGR